jgi:hypothetical protein
MHGRLVTLTSVIAGVKDGVAQQPCLRASPRRGHRGIRRSDRGAWLWKAGWSHGLNLGKKCLASNPMANPMSNELTSTYGS